MQAGILNLNKPRGPTSHDIVARVRHLTGVRRVGHAGTLDPMATGVLLLCIGKATRVAEYLIATRKAYWARLRLGVSTTTYDAEGQVTGRAQVRVDQDRIDAVLGSLRGKIRQMPPMYSAIKRDGVPLYRLARQGIEVKREPRQVEIFSLVLCAWDRPTLDLDVVCSAGTYVRSLAHDIGQALGCGAHVTRLTRRASGAFELADSVAMDDFARAASEGHWREHLLPIEAALADFPALRLDRKRTVQLCHGQAVPATRLPADVERSGDRLLGSRSLVRVHGIDGRVIAVARVDREMGLIWPHKVFCSPDEVRCG